MAKKLATSIIAGDRIVVSLAATKGDAAGARRAFAGTFNHLGQQIDADGRVQFGTPSLDMEKVGAPAAGGAPVFPIEEFQEAIKLGGGRPSARSMQIQADYEVAVAAWEAGNGGGATIGDRIAEAVLNFCEKYYDIKRTEGLHAYLDPAQVVVRPAYRDGDAPVVFSVTLAPVWGTK